MASRHPVVAKTRTSWRERLSMVVVMAVFGVAAAALVVALSAKDESGNVTRRVDRAGPPCVDVNGKRPGLVPSAGCEEVYRLLVEKCARDPEFCRRSQRQAVENAQARSVRDEIGPRAQLGGGGSKGNNPQSPTGPRGRGPVTPVEPREPPDGVSPGPGPQEPPGRPQQPQNPPSDPPPQNPPPQPVDPNPPTVDLPGVIPDTLKPPLCDIAGVCLP
jgi:hypothetical protein